MSRAIASSNAGSWARPRHTMAVFCCTAMLGAATLPADFQDEYALTNSPDANPAPSLRLSAEPEFRMSLRLRDPAASWIEPFTKKRRFALGEYVEAAAPRALPVRLEWLAPEPWDWAGLRRQLLRELGGELRVRFSPQGIVVEPLRSSRTAAPRGTIADASTAARVRSRLAGEPLLRGTGATASCRDGRITLAGRFLQVTQTARALRVALAVDGVREAAVGLPTDLERESRANR